MTANNPQTHSSSPFSKGSEGQSASAEERVERAAEQLANDAVDRVRRAREQASSGVTEQRDQVVDRIRRVGDALRVGSVKLAEEDPLAERLLRMTSERFEGLADYVGNATAATLADDLQSFARRRPGVFFGGAFILGLAVGRFARSSTTATGSDHRSDSDYQRSESGYGARTNYGGSPSTSSTAGYPARSSYGSGATHPDYGTRTGPGSSSEPRQQSDLSAQTRYMPKTDYGARPDYSARPDPEQFKTTSSGSAETTPQPTERGHGAKS